MKKISLHELKEFSLALIILCGYAAIGVAVERLLPSDGQQAWIPIAALAVSAASAIGGAIGNARARRKQQQMLNEEQNRLNSEKKELQTWYDREYYQNPLATEEAQAAQAQARDYLAEENQKADSRAAMSGASDEARIAQRGESQKAWTNLVRGLSAAGTNYKRAVNSQYMQGRANLSGRQSNLAGQQMDFQQDRANSGTAIINNALQLGGSAIMGMGDYPWAKTASA